MEEGNSGADWNQPGGIISLARFVTEHKEAVEYDLITKTGNSLQDVGRRLDWSALNSIIRNIAPDSALMRELHPDVYQWATPTKTNALLADIYDVLNAINANLCAKGTGKRAKRPKPYPRPIPNKSERHIGTPVPIEELHRRIFGK